MFSTVISIIIAIYIFPLETFNLYSGLYLSKTPSDLSISDDLLIKLKTENNRLLNNEANQLTKIETKLTQIEQKLITLEEKLSATNFSKIRLPKHCKGVKEKGQNKTGFYFIQPEFSERPFLVLCDMEIQDGGWTYLMNRYNGVQSFYQSWEDYKKGFGNIGGEFWLGLERFHILTGYEPNELLIELEDWENNKTFAHYYPFSVGDENEGYSLKLVGKYSGDAGDSFSYHAGNKFSTMDKDQDLTSQKNCARDRRGGWWYKDCTTAHLTGEYYQNSTTHGGVGIYWNDFRGYYYSLKKVKMMVRPSK